MMFLSDWMKTFSEKINPIITKLIANTQQPNTRNTQHALGGGVEDDGGFGEFLGA